jgi:hypothetical protein
VPASDFSYTAHELIANLRFGGDPGAIAEITFQTNASVDGPEPASLSLVDWALLGMFGALHGRSKSR